ncbi:MAG: hypothetical protein IKJ82_04710 [Oscillospiraceae bacterium]|nr:hypothetical protein [Oscillospiraceae bacterium]
MNMKIFKDKRIVFAISLVVSFIFWLTVSLVLRPSGEIVVSGVGVNVNVQSGLLAELGLSAIEGSESTVDVVISGSRSVIGGVSAEDISVTPSLSGVTGAGVYELDLRAINNTSKDFEIVGVNPSSITVKFDKYVDKTVELKYEINGEYNIPDEYVQEEIYTDPRHIVITGPEKDIEGIAGALVSVELSGEYSETIEALGEVVLVDEDGNPVDYNRNEISTDINFAKVIIPIHRTARLPISFGFINIPENFDVSNLSYTLSVTDILVEGQSNIIEKYSDIFLGYVDMRDITPENPVASFDIELPEGLSLQDHLDEVNIFFDLEGYAETTFNVSQINIINVPQGYKVTSNASKVAVTLIGPEEVLNELSNKDIVVQVDLSTREITQTGQYRIYAEVMLPGGQNAWATGLYSVTVTVKEQ